METASGKLKAPTETPVLGRPQEARVRISNRNTKERYELNIFVAEDWK